MIYNVNMKKVMLLYPPGVLYQRGEDRCQVNVNETTVNTVRACNDLGYASSVLKKRGYSVFLKDYQSEGLSLKNLLDDVESQKPDVVFLSTTNATIFDDLKIIIKIKDIKNDIVFILKGAIFYNCNGKLLSYPEFKNIDYMIGGEEEFIIGDLIDYHFKSPAYIPRINGIIYKKDGQFYQTENNCFVEDLDSLPFPDREEMNNDLYLIPDTGEKLATISTSRGCPSSCIYCLSPQISGRKIRIRSVKNVMQEMEECYFKFGIRNFFFKADTFTMNRAWVCELCNSILDSKLKGKIRWFANSRVNTIDLEMLKLMKKSGCYLLAFGLESGSNESLEKMKKNTTVEMNYNAVQLAKKAGLLTVGFYIIGFPWEDFSHFEMTKKAMFKNNTDFIELHIATPFVGTPLYMKLKEEGIIKEEIYGTNHYTCTSGINPKLNPLDVEKFRKKTVLEYYTRPSYIIKKVYQSILNPKILFNYFKYGIRLLKITFKK